MERARPRASSSRERRRRDTVTAVVGWTGRTAPHRPLGAVAGRFGARLGNSIEFV